MADYEGMDEAQLRQLLDSASSYEERSSIRKAIRKLTGSSSKKKVGSSNYRRAGYQAPTTMAIPNSVTGNILPNKVNAENLGKTEVPSSTATISYLKNRSQTVSSPRADSSGGRRSTSSPISAASPRGSVSSYTSDLSGRNDQEDVEGERSSSVTGGRTPSPMAQMSKTRVNGISSPAAPPPSKEVSPPPREPTPPPPREPTPPPPKEPTPPPPREPTPPPPKEPTPPPPREPTPEPEEEPEVEEEEVEEVVEEEVEEEEEEEEEEEDDEQEHTEGVKVNYDSEEDEDDDRKRTYSPSQGQNYRASRSTGGAPTKTIVPLDVLTKKEEGIDGGNFRNKLQKASNTKIDTTSAFPQARPKGEQVDFRNVLKKKDTAKVDTTAAFPQAKTKGEQIDFRNVLKKTDKKDPIPSPKPSRSRRLREEEPEESEEVAEREEKSASPETEPAEETEEAQEEEEAAAEQEEEELKVEEEEKEEENQQEEAVDGSSPADQQTGGRGSTGSGEVEEDSYEARQAERRRRREQRQRELAAITDDKSSEKASTKESSKSDTSSSTASSSGTGELDSYEARREARRKAREERLKAASARVGEEGGTKMSYKEKKALEARKNAKDSRNKWESREEDSGAKKEAKPANFKKKDSATQQLLAWCQHKTKFYENVDIKDFRSSWSDGLAFCAIMHSFLPDKIPYDELTPEDKRRNFTLAFEAAKDAGIPEMLDVDDMLMVKIPDAKSIMTFLVTIYQHFNS